MDEENNLGESTSPIMPDDSFDLVSPIPIAPTEDVPSYPSNEFLNNATNEELDLYIQCALIQVEQLDAPQEEYSSYYELAENLNCPIFWNSPQNAYISYSEERNKRKRTFKRKTIFVIAIATISLLLISNFKIIKK